MPNIIMPTLTSCGVIRVAGLLPHSWDDPRLSCHQSKRFSGHHRDLDHLRHQQSQTNCPVVMFSHRSRGSKKAPKLTAGIQCSM